MDPLPQPIKTVRIADRTYELYQRPCSKCGGSHYRAYRWCGNSFSCYRLPDDFDEREFDDFVGAVDERLLDSASDMFAHFLEAMTEINSPEGIAVDRTFAFQLLEYGRHRASKLQKLKLLDAIELPAEPKTKAGQAVRAAFELGMAAAEHRLMTYYEDYLQDGFAIAGWREAGLPKARAERLRQGKQSRAAVIAAAKKLYKERPQLIRNDSETAREISKLNLDELQKPNGGSLGLDAITRHLRSARAAGQI